MKVPKSRRCSAVALAAFAASLASTAWSAITLVSTPTGAPTTAGNASSFTDDISANGRYVVFSSLASNLVAGDANGVQDIFVRDTVANTTERISVTPSGGDADADSFVGKISADGRFVAFTSSASNLVAGNDPATIDLFIRDRSTGTTQSVAVIAADPSDSFSATYSFAINGDGRYVAFHTSSHGLDPLHPGGNIYRFDRQTGLFAAVDLSTAGVPADLFYPPRPLDISTDGRYIAFVSADPDLAPGDANNNRDLMDTFLRDMVANTTERVSDGFLLESESPSISDDGRYVAFIYGRYMSSLDPSLRLAIRDRVTQTFEYADAFPLAPEGIQGVSISGDGRFVGFNVDGFPSHSGSPDVYVYDRTLRRTTRISENLSGGIANSYSLATALSADGHTIAFSSNASDLVSGDTNGVGDSFVASVTFPTSWHSQDAQLSSGSPQASVLSDDASVVSAAIEFYESTNDFGIAEGLPFGSYDSVHPQNWFNKMQAYWSNDSQYPYAGKSAVGRGSDTGETGAFGQLGALDMQLHPPANNHLTVAAFIVPRSGRYSVSELAVRRIDGNGQTAKLYLFKGQGQQIQSLQATNRRDWVRDFQGHDLGNLNAGDHIYFAVGADGGYEYDATEITWQVDAKLDPAPPAEEIVWNSYDNNLPVEYFQTASLSGGNPTVSLLFDSSSGAHPEGFNHVSSFVAPTGQLYPYAGRSSAARGSDTGESNASAPLGVFDMQVHPPEGDSGRTIVAFNVTQPGEYTLSDVAVRRVDNRGDYSNLCVYVNAQMVGTCMDARNDRAWVRDSQSHDLGTLQTGDKIYFAVSPVDGDYAFDATEIAWKIRANIAP